MTLLVHPKQLQNYSNLGTFRYKSASGIIATAETIRLRAAAIDDVRFSDIKVGRLPAGGGTESTLGIDLIGRHPFSVNFHDSPSIKFNPKPPRQLLASLKVHSTGLLNIPVVINGNPARALWDTGASVTAVDRAYIKSHPETFKRSGTRVQGTDGSGHSLELQAFRAKKITIGSRTFRDVPVVSADLSVLRETLGNSVSVVIGFNLIRKTDWYFDARQKLWSIR